MKKVLVVITLLFISFISFGQNKPVKPVSAKEATEKIDTNWLPATDTVEFVCERDINRVLAILGNDTKVTPNEFLKIRMALEAVLINAVNRKRGKNQ